MSDDDLHALALAFASGAHAGTYRGDKATPYIVHPITVSKLVKAFGGSDAAIIAALLHDVVEDTPTTVADIEAKFGSVIARLVDEVTFPADLPDRRSYMIHAVRSMSHDAKLIKLCDALSNYFDLPSANWTPVKKLAYRSYLLKIIGAALDALYAESSI